MQEETKDIEAVDPGDTRAFLLELTKLAEKKSDVGEEMGSLKSDFVDETGYNKTALSFAARLHKLSADKRGDVFRSLDKIRDDMAAVWAQGATEEMNFDDGDPE